MSFINKEDNDYHLIVTTHPYLVELGLGTMTTGTLYEWWNQSTAEGAYLNQKSVNDYSDLENPTEGVEALLGMSRNGLIPEFFWQGWKPHAEFENTGRYLRQNLSEYGEGFSGDKDDSWTFVSDAGPVDVSNLSGPGVIGNHKKCFIGGSLVEGEGEGGLEFKPNYSTAPTLNPDTLEKMDPIFDLINLNRYMASFKDYYPRALWEENSKTIGGVDTKEIYANHELLTEIKTSKIGPYVEWSGEITFYVNENHGTIDSLPITEWASFKLYLFDRASSKGSNKSVTVKNLTYVAPKRDVTGKTFSSSVDGGHKESEVDDPSSHGAAELDLSYNSVTKKWDGGTPQLFAKLVTNIGKPPSMPTVEYLETNEVEDSLSNDDYVGVKVIPAKGTAMPIRPQNGNPHQWQPNYLESDDVRCSTKATDKETLTVYNYNSKRSFERDEEVLLSKIDGQWHVFPLWSGNDVEDDETVAGDIGKWGEFSYLFTNSDYFFLANDGGRFSPREAEQSFHKDYYSGDALNEDVEYGVDGGYDYSQPFTNKDVREIRFKNGFAQQTSFDYLDSKLFGIRDKEGTIVAESSEDKCSISTTSAVINAAGQVIPSPSEYTSRNAAHAGVFFGCIFPDGYVGVNDYLDKRLWNVAPQNAGEMTKAENYFITGKGNSSVNIFEDVNDDRNNCRQPASAEPMGDLGGSKWSRRDSRASASLFAEYQQYKVTTFKQMPADVMTNASPEGKNGSPLQPIGRFVDFHNPDTNNIIVNTSRDVARRAFIQGVWLGKEAAGGDTAVYTENDSAFDFSPVSRNSLTFRPCKLENYIQFGKNNVGSADLIKDLTQATVQTTRKGFHVEASRTQLDDKRPCTYFFEDREKPNVETRLLSDDGLIWGGDVSEQNRPRYNNLHEFNYWNSSQGALRWTQRMNPNWKGSMGGAAFGVITTFNTITANSQIDFSTDNIYGMGAAANGRFSIQAGYANQDRTWGVSSFIQSYRQENILDLSIRLYQQHPREQLLFDPRTYAVHHFNPDVRYADDKYTEDNGEITPFSRETEVFVGKGYDEEGKDIEFNYNYSVPFSEVDFQEVSRYEKFMEYKPDPSKEHEEGKDYSPQPLPITSYILSDVTVDEGEKKPPVMEEKFWVVNTSRAGKLLPFRYQRRKVGIPTPTGILISTDGSPGYPLSRIWSKSAITLEADTPVIDLVSLIIVKNIGNGYAVGDILGNEAKGISLKVESVSETVGPGAYGEVLTFSCTDRGSLTASDSASSSDKFSPGSDGPIKIETLQSGTGEGFDAYYVASAPYDQIYTDPKPFLMKRDGEEIVRIAADEPQGTHRTAGGSSEAEGGAFINESREVTYILDPTLKSANSRYDVFFHFHNDITMTWLASDPNFHGDARNSTECAEQHVTVRINPR